MAGGLPHSPAAILAMLRHLPEGSLYRATIEARMELERKELQRRKDAGEDVEIPEPDEPSEFERLVQEKQTWLTIPTLLAEGLNRDRFQVMSLFPEEHRPEFPVMGPEAWWPESQKKTHQKSDDSGERPLSLLERHFGKRADNG